MIVYRGILKAIVHRDMWQSCIVELDPIVKTSNRVSCPSCNREMAIVARRAIVNGAHRAIVKWIGAHEPCRMMCHDSYQAISMAMAIAMGHGHAPAFVAHAAQS